MAQTLSHALAWWARMRPEQPAVVLAGESLTYQNYKLWSDAIASYLVAEGVQPGDRVAICSTNSLTYCALIMGIIRAGAIVNPINFRYTPREISDLLEATEPKLIFAAADFSGNVEKAGYATRPISEIDGLRHEDTSIPAHDPDPDASVVIIATSGSTAKPKGVVFTNRSMTAYAANWSVEEPSTAPGARIIGLAPLNTSAGFVQLMHYMCLGCTYYMEPVFDPSKALALIQSEKINGFGAVPVFFESIAALPEFAQADLSSIKIATVGGARVSRQLLDTYRAKGVTLRQIYGQTEIGGNATVMPEHLALEAAEKCGWGGAFIDIRVVRDDGSDCDANEVGQILMRGPGMMRHYWRDPEQTAQAIKDGWLYSGDLGTLDENGLLTFVDRMKDLIISGGLNISAAEVEAVVSEFPGITEVVVIAAPDEKFGETPLAVYHGPQEVDVAALITHCNENLSNYKVPRYVAFSADPLPRVATGKLSKPQIRQNYANAHKELPRVR